MSDGKQSLARRRILAGQCPLCGKEAAPYRLCWTHRQQGRITRLLKRGGKYGVIKSERRPDGLYFSAGDRIDDPEAKRLWYRWSTDWNLPESDRRGRPRLRGISVDVETTLVEVIRRIGRPCTIEEITEAWGRLRDRRSSPLSSDLATIIAAKDKREAKMRKRAKLASFPG